MIEKGEIKTLHQNQRGNEFVEAAIVIPIITGVVMLILHLFVFYLNILATGARAHQEAWKKWTESEAIIVNVNRRIAKTQMLSKGMLDFLPENEREILFYDLNEDRIVRAKGITDEK